MKWQWEWQKHDSWLNVEYEWIWKDKGVVAMIDMMAAGTKIVNSLNVKVARLELI